MSALAARSFPAPLASPAAPTSCIHRDTFAHHQWVYCVPLTGLPWQTEARAWQEKPRTATRVPTEAANDG